MQKIGFGGGCHWCTEAVFQSLICVIKVHQGWISSKEDLSFSEGIIVEYDGREIDLSNLIEIHLHTHSCTSNHSMRQKYRSAVYVWNETDKSYINSIIQSLQGDFIDPIITKAYEFDKFKENNEQYQNYYYNNPDKAFCSNFIEPKIQLLMNKFKKVYKINK